MKIKIITCHDVYNFGASLQAYAFVTYLNLLGHDTEIIDYKPDYLRNHYSLIAIGNLFYDRPVLREIYILLKLPGRLRARYGKRKRAFDRFRDSYLPVTTRRFASNVELKAHPPEADVFFAGSDQIWNPLFQNGRDPAFYLDFAPDDSIKASYAASFATDVLPVEWRAQIKNWLSALHYCSVREKSGLDILNSIGVLNGKLVLDPVFLLNADVWEKMEQPVKNTEPYLLLYDFGMDSTIEELVKKLARDKGLKIYSVFPHNFCHKNFSYIGPQGFLSLVHNAKLVVSNSFHALAFSLIFHKEFLVFNRSENINTRTRDLLELLDLNDCYLGNCTYDSIMKRKIDYKKTDEKLQEQIKQSKQYIDWVLKGAK